MMMNWMLRARVAALRVLAAFPGPAPLIGAIDDPWCADADTRRIRHDLDVIRSRYGRWPAR